MARVCGYTAPTASRFVLAGVAAIAAGCSRGSAPPVRTDHTVRYVLEWNSSTVAPGSGGAFEVTNDLGYRVRVTRGYVVSRDLELSPCAIKPPPTVAFLLESIESLLAPRPAYAGHTGIADPSSTKIAQVESLLDVQPHAGGTVHPGAQTYCQAYYLIARADRDASGLPAEIDMVDQSVYVEGTFRRPGGSADEPFIVKTGVANGTLINLTAGGAAVRLNTGTQSAQVTFRRSRDTLFNRVDFATMAEKRIGREMLQNLISSVAVELRVEPDA